MPSERPLPGTVWVRNPSNRPLYYNLKEFVSYAAFSIQDIPDVSISSPTAGQVLTFNGVDWVNGAGSGGGVTSILTTGPITGGPISSTGTIGITQATTTTDGYLSSVDWNLFDAKQNAITLGTTAQYFRGDLSLATFPTIPTVTPSALTKTDDTNVTLTLGGTPSTALLQSVQLILGWTGTLADGRISSASTWNAKQSQLSGTGFVKASGTTISYDNSSYYLASNPSNYISLTSLSSGTGISYNNTTGVITNSSPDQTVVLNNGTGISVTGTYPNFTITNTSPSTVSPAALTRTNDTNVTLTLSGTPATSLLQSVGMTLGWTGTLADARIASSTNWNTAYTNRITSLTTTGSSGASTLVSNILNVPTYTLAGLGGISLTSLSATTPVLYDNTTGVFSMHVADSTHNGYLSSTDWSTFNTKQVAGNYITALTGDVTASGPGSSAATLATVNSNVGTYTYPSVTVNAKGLITAISSGAAPITYTFSTGLTNTAGTVTVNTSQSISTLSNLTTNGFIKTSGGTGALSIDTSTYLTANQSITFTPTGDVTGSSSGATSLTPALTIANGAVTLAKMSNLSAPNKIVGRYSAGAGVPQELTISTGLSLDGSGNLTATGSGGTVTSVTSADGNATIANTTSTPVITIVSAPKLQTARTINGTSFDGSANITVTAAAGTLTGTTLNSTVVTTSITSTGTMTSGTLSTGYVIGGVTMTLGSDASYDLYYRNASGVLTRLANGTTGQYLAATTSSAPSWATLTPSFAGMVDTISLQDIGSAIPAQTYTFELYAEIGYTINELKIISGSGTCNAAVQINGTNVTGISALSVSSTIATGTASAANTVVIGNKVTLVISSNSSLVNLQATLKYTRT